MHHIVHAYFTCQDDTVNNRKLSQVSKCIDYETGTLARNNKQRTDNPPIRRKAYAGRQPPSTTTAYSKRSPPPSYNTNKLKHIAGVDLINNNRPVPIYRRENSIDDEDLGEMMDDTANDYIDVYLRKISTTR